MPITVSPIQAYNPATAWFDLSSYSGFGQNERNPIQSLEQANLWLIDASQLILSSDYAPRVAFINEGAGYQNRVNLTATYSSGVQESRTLFSNLSGTNSILPSSNAPLQIGDWLQLSTLSAGTQIDLSVIPNGNRTPLWTDPSRNPTNAANPHSPVFWVAYADPYATNPLFILGFEDILGSGSDNDYNDGILALDLGLENFQEIFQSYNFGQPTINQISSAGGLDVLTSTSSYVSAASLPPVTSSAVPFSPQSGLALLAIGSWMVVRRCFRTSRTSLVETAALPAAAGPVAE